MTVLLFGLVITVVRIEGNCFEVMQQYIMQEILLDEIERIYNGSMIKIEMESIMTGWCKSDSGVSILLFNIYVRELCINVSACKQGVSGSE